MKCDKCSNMTEELWKNPQGEKLCEVCVQEEWSGK